MSTTKTIDPISYIESAFLDTKGGKGRKARRSKAEIGEGDVRFRKTSLTAPRPRRAKDAAPVEPILDEDLKAYLADMPQLIEFLGTFFTDEVTTNYYKGDFKESRTELIRRILDPELSLEEVSRLLGVCPATVRRYTNRGWLKHHRTKGGQRRFRMSYVIRFAKEHGRHPEE
jgi:excisionase family DNA binding protein